MPPSPPSLRMSTLREIFSRSDKEKLSSDLKRALSLLQLSGIEALEERFLATDAFLRPWAVFRDSTLLQQPNSMPHATALDISGAAGGVSRLDVLWFYTQFDEDSLRYDPRADRSTFEYTTDSSIYGVIDKSQWGVGEHEKHLYAWLLQEFKVGKTYNPQGFQYFELKSVCSAWQEVFVPIANAVRASYHVKGRQHYGRLALFVENRCPSRLAFPGDNVGIAEGDMMSPTPFRVVSMPKKGVNNGGSAFHTRGNSFGVLTKKHYDETEKELRHVYPQYGGLVERPKFKHKMEEWLADQRMRADRRKASERHGEVKSFQPQVFQGEGSHHSPRMSSTPSTPKRQASYHVSTSSIKRYSNSIRRSLSLSISKRLSTEEQRSPLHGVTRQVYIPDDQARDSPLQKQKHINEDREQSVSSLGSTDTVIKRRPRPDLQQRKGSEQSVYTSICNSNPFTEGTPGVSKTPQPRTSTSGSVFSPMGQLSAIPRPLNYNDEHGHAIEPIPFVRLKQSYADVRVPSYEGNDYTDEISLTNLHLNRKNSVRTSEPVRLAKPFTRLPVPIKPIPYTGPLRAASKDTNRAEIPQPVAWPGFESDDDDIAPPIPSKSPERWNPSRGHASSSRPQQLVRHESHAMTRIVSKENIRAALGGISRESSAEELAPPVPKLAYMEGNARKMSPSGTKLQTYNTHMFPRKGTPANGSETQKKVLKGGKKGS
ncbi:Nn.00g117050.m01.CDS01 [Neocucurbitaria sp. VM-36]